MTLKDNEIRICCKDPIDFLITINQDVVNGKVCIGFNKKGNYELDKPEFCGLSLCFEPNYESPSGPAMEVYLEGQSRDGDQSSVRRGLMCKYRCDTGEFEAVELSAGPGGQVALCAHDGQAPNATGLQMLTVRGDGVRIAGDRLEVGGAPVLRGLDLTTGAIIVGAGAARFRIPAEAMPPSAPSQT